MIIKETAIFTKWISKLDFTIKSVVYTYIERLAKNNFTNTKPIGDNIHELKINFQKGYRIYFVNANGEIIILLCGGDKSSQNKDIEKAKEIKKIGGY